jgi:phosphopantetheine adenylyltransferase
MLDKLAKAIIIDVGVNTLIKKITSDDKNKRWDEHFLDTIEERIGKIKELVSEINVKNQKSI